MLRNVAENLIRTMIENKQLVVYFWDISTPPAWLVRTNACKDLGYPSDFKALRMPCGHTRVPLNPVTIPWPLRTSTHWSKSHGIPVNLSQGAVLTDLSRVFVSGLSKNAGEREIERYFGQAGAISHIELGESVRNGKPKATIKYSSADGAREAIRRFNGDTFMDSRLHVKLEKNAGKPSDSEPTIVDGSRGCRQ